MHHPTRAPRAFAFVAALSLGFWALAARAADGVPPLALDPAIQQAVASVSAADLRDFDTRLVGFGTRNVFATFDDPKRGVIAARDFIAAQFRSIAQASGGRMTVTLDTYEQAKTDRTPRAVTVSSVIATLRGDDPARGTIVISSHYDSRNGDGNDATRDAPGADDNGSGSSCVVAAARALAAMHFPATIVFATFDGEEQGLFGSGHYAKVLHENGVDVEANLNNDIIGASVGHDGESAPNDVRLFSEALPPNANLQRVNLIGSENDSPSRELARAVKEIAEAYVPPMRANLIYRSDRFLRGGDQESFADQGFPAVRFVEQHENFDHQHQNIRIENNVQYGDLLRYVDFDYLANVTRMNVAALATLALAPPRPVARIVVRDLGYATTLTWQRVPRAASYEIVWRATDEPLWTHAVNTGDVTTYTSPLSKDDWIFGVRAVDATGHKSVAGYPTPIR